MYKIKWDKFRWSKLERKKKIRILLFACGVISIIVVCTAFYLIGINRPHPRLQLHMHTEDRILNPPGVFGKELSIAFEEDMEELHKIYGKYGWRHE